MWRGAKWRWCSRSWSSPLAAGRAGRGVHWFLREAHLLSTLRHRSLPMLHASFSDGDRSYLVMEAVPGPSLEMRAVHGGPLTEAQVLRWGIELCEVLHFLHSQPEPIIYRDLKPANVLERADTGELVLVDFGVARRDHPRRGRHRGGHAGLRRARAVPGPGRRAQRHLCARRHPAPAAHRLRPGGRGSLPSAPRAGVAPGCAPGHRGADRPRPVAVPRRAFRAARWRCARRCGPRCPPLRTCCRRSPHPSTSG